MYITCKWLCVSIFFTLLDISSKHWVSTHLSIGDTRYIIPGINCYYIYNAGLAFGLFSYMDPCYKLMLILINVLIIIMFIVVLYRAVYHHLIYESLFYAIIIGGATGNLHDRILYGAVIDFIDCYIKDWHWPIFNIADIEICVGLVLLMIRYAKLSNHNA